MVAKHRRVVIGLGNKYRGDDAVGPIVTDMLRAMQLPDVIVVSGIEDGVSLISHWDDADICIVVDCVVTDGVPGEIYRFCPLESQFPANFRSSYSTHALGLSQVIELARAIGRLPRRLVVFGIEGLNFISGTPIGCEVRKAALKAARLIRKELAG